MYKILITTTVSNSFGEKRLNTTTDVVDFETKQDAVDAATSINSQRLILTSSLEGCHSAVCLFRFRTQEHE
jgi:hypothetical protein